MDKNRQVSIETPLGDGLVFQSMSADESLGQLFRYSISLKAISEDVDPAKLIGETVCVRLFMEDEAERYFHGYVSRFSHRGSTEGGDAQYSIEVRPWLWMLTRNADCRMFHEKSVPDILKEVFSANGFSDYELKLNKDYRVWEYCAQYRETDFNFVSRLMEQEGIYYYFKHESAKHTLVLADGYSSHSAIEGNPSLTYHRSGVGKSHDTRTVSGWQSNYELQSGAYALTDYDFKKPATELVANRKIQRDHAEASREMFDYAAGHKTTDEGDAYALARIEELHANYAQFSAETDAMSMQVGGLFTLTAHPRKDQNREYLVTACVYELQANNPTSGGGAGEPFQCNFQAIEGGAPFRTPRTTTKPAVHGPQPAMVVDDMPDEYGRVKVQFYWDREKTQSCWVRVSQNSAGSGWGTMFVPHNGQEVIVSYYEGDPDRPVITGKVYNQDNMPPDLWKGSTTNSVITDHVENKINLDGEATPIIHITQPGGNEILMNDEEGIQIRDKFGNEIVADSVAGTLKMRSPSHESEIVLGRSVLISTDSDEKTIIKGNSEHVVSGKASVKIFDATSETFIGLKNSNQLAATFETFYGLKTKVSRAMDISKNWETKIIKDKVVKREAETSVLEKSAKIEYASEKSKLMLNAKRALLMSGKSQVLLKKDADISVHSNAKLLLNAKEAISVKSKKGISLSCPGKPIAMVGKKITLG